ncbi:MAG: hypothetical protein QW503_02490 [Sulfolobales archaeon]
MVVNGLLGPLVGTMSALEEYEKVGPDKVGIVLELPKIINLGANEYVLKLKLYEVYGS